CLLSMMYRLVLQKSVTVTSVRKCSHISRVSSDRVWISDLFNLILTNTAGDKLHHLTDIRSIWGGHTVNNDGDLIYIDSHDNINKLSTENKVKTTLIKYTAPWRPLSVYSSPSTGDLLVGMCRFDTKTGKLVQYNSTGEHIQTIQYNNNTGQRLYRYPSYITENRNGDVIVSDFGRDAVVVTDRGGSLRFSYTGPPSGSRLRPRGICTDGLSHILVCDWFTHSVQMIDREGNFLSQIQTSPHGINRPQGLSYDDTTHLLWVGSAINNTVNIYRVVDRDSLTGLPKCKYHPRGTLEDFCVTCEVPLCKECTSEDHRGHDCRDVRRSLGEIHTQIDGDAVLMCLLLCKLYRINLKEGRWIEKYNAVAESFNFKKITTESSPANLEKFSPILKYNNSEIMFSHEFLRHASFLNFVEDPKFLDIFLTWAEKENIVEYCRSWIYPSQVNEVFCWLLPQQTEQLIERLGEDIFKHPTWQDTSVHDMVFSKVGIPMQIIMRGDKTVKNYIENLRKGRTMMYHASGMIVGCAGSGKTTLLERLKGIDLKEILKNTKSTRGIDVHYDIFDVSNTIKVNSSDQKQHFKVTFDETSQIHDVPEPPVEVTDDLKKQDIEVPMEGENIASDIVSVEQTSGANMNLEADLSKGINAATLSDKPIGEIDDRENVAQDSEISGILRVTRNVSDDPEKRITMVDFAGQCAYYASHQIFLSPRAFFILVLNMEKRFDDKVGEEVCCQEGSIFKEWTYKGLKECFLSYNIKYIKVFL
ncbi:uncharacterized protein LOC133201966, partial [Saccostrea echinata]|uniref:uncharacterized protein LOC133201966 n=1 Tax=Saccostrea echinata TaxID=191078 RepID=UPI002A80C706